MDALVRFLFTRSVVLVFFGMPLCGSLFRGSSDNLYVLNRIGDNKYANNSRLKMSSARLWKIFLSHDVLIDTKQTVVRISFYKFVFNYDFMLFTSSSKSERISVKYSTFNEIDEKKCIHLHHNISSSIHYFAVGW